MTHPRATHVVLSLSSPLAWWLPIHSESVPGDHQGVTSCPRWQTEDLHPHPQPESGQVPPHLSAIGDVPLPHCTAGQSLSSQISTLHPFISSLNFFTWPLRPFFQLQFLSLPSIHYPNSSHVELLKVLKTLHYPPIPPSLQAVCFSGIFFLPLLKPPF